VNGQRVAIGGPKLLVDLKAAIPPELAKTVTMWASEGLSVLYVLRDSSVIGSLTVEDEIWPESAEAVKGLHELGVRVTMVTGDSQTVADSVARRLGIDEVLAQVLPADKASIVKQVQSRDKTVAMVGDGVNDAPAVESAGIVLVRSDPRDVVHAIKLSRTTYRKMVQNLVWATAYNLIAIPAAAGVFIRWKLDFPMSVGAIAMNLSTIIVALNAHLLHRVKL